MYGTAQADEEERVGMTHALPLKAKLDYIGLILTLDRFIYTWYIIVTKNKGGNENEVL